MNSGSSNCSDRANETLIEIVETLEECGLEFDSYQIRDYVDPDMLKRLITSVNGEVTVQFTVEGVPLEVSPDGVNVIEDEGCDTGTE